MSKKGIKIDRTILWVLEGNYKIKNNLYENV